MGGINPVQEGLGAWNNTSLRGLVGGKLGQCCRRNRFTDEGSAQEDSL